MSYRKTHKRTMGDTRLAGLARGTITPSNVLGTFGKAIKSGRGLSFSLSASEFCDDTCAVKGAGCYAETIEGLYPELGAKLLRHSRQLFNVVRCARLAIAKQRALGWFRLCVSGGLPMPEHFANTKQWGQFRKVFRAMISEARERCPVHLPTESRRKALAYRRVVEGTGVVVRRTCQTLASALRSKDHRAVRVGLSTRPCHREENIRLAFMAAESIRRSGQTAIVCPAVVGDSKCGKCVACASPKVDCVVYPLHS